MDAKIKIKIEVCICIVDHDDLGLHCHTYSDYYISRNVLWSPASVCVCVYVCVCVCVCLSVCLSAAACPHYCTDPDVAWGSGMGCPLVVHYWADLQSVHGLRCYGSITRTLVHACTRSMPSCYNGQCHVKRNLRPWFHVKIKLF